MKFAEMKIQRSQIQATRHEPAREVVDYCVRIPELGALSNGWMSCKTIQDAERLAAQYGYALQGDAGQMKLPG